VNTNGLSDLIAGEPTAAKFAGLVDAISISLNAPDAEEYCELCRPRFGLESYGAMLKFAAEVSKFVEKTILSIVATPDTTDEKIDACRKIADGLGVQLRVRRYES
jgi:TatD family-associated radical SAM protein